MKKKELKVFLALVLLFSLPGLFLLGRNLYLKQIKGEASKGAQGANIEAKAKVYGVNEYVNVDMNASQMGRIYVKDFYNIMTSDPQAAYQLLDKTFVEKQTITFDQFKVFVASVLADENSTTITKQKLKGSQNRTIYDIITKSGVHYTFSCEGIMVYTVKYELQEGGTE